MTMKAGRAGKACRELVHNVFQRFGFDIYRYPLPSYLFPDPASEMWKRIRNPILKEKHITVVLDIGANIGQYAQCMRNSGYGGRIVSFEPLSAQYEMLSRQAVADGEWECRRLALGDIDGEMEISVAGNSVSSSLLPMCDSHVEAEPRSAYVGTQQVAVSRLDSIAPGILKADDRVWLKLDVQGYEKNVILGACNTLSQVAVVECELSLLPLYKGQALYHEMIGLMEQNGFTLASVGDAFNDLRTGRLLQFDGIFTRQTRG
ncbi:MAG: FkbM family methyltransferase [bacterium]